jgi:calcineurin-like phosphoesterase family protein
MSCITRFIGCLHLGHKNMAIHRGFGGSEEHDEYLISQWNSVVLKKKDITYILGDITMEKSCCYPLLNCLNGIKHVILGNHDRRQDIPELLNYVDSVGGAVKYKGYILTHIPIHPNEIGRFKGNIHAHIHHINKLEPLTVKESYTDNDNYINSGNKYYFNVDAKLIDFKPKTIEELLTNK